MDNLNKDLTDLLDEVERLRLERDAAVEDLKFGWTCRTCKHFLPGNGGREPCISCDSEKHVWKWRGTKEVTEENG